MARPSKFNPQYHIPWIKGLAQRGLTVPEIAQEIGVARSTVNKWLAEDEELSDAVKKGRSYADSQVETSLYKRAIGYTFEERKTILTTEKEGETPTPRVEITKKEIPADVTACIFWLKNRRPDLWRDRIDNAISGKLSTVNEGKVSLSKVPDELLEQVLNKLNGGE